MAFWGCVLKPGQKHPVQIQDGDVLHLSQACLHDPKDGKNYLQAEVDGTAYSIACLEKGKREHDCLDLFFDSQKTSFVAKGNSEIHLMGYIEPSNFGEDSESESPAVVTKAVSPKLAPKVVAASSPKVSASSPKTSPKAVAEDSDDDFSEGEEEEEEESESPAQAAAPQKGSPKRQAPSEPQASPAKKAKGDDAEEAAYIKKLIEHLKANGKTNLGQLGSKVARPAGVPKMKAVIEAHKDKFTMVGDVVTAK